MKEKSLNILDDIIGTMFLIWFLFITSIMFLHETATIFFILTVSMLGLASFSNRQKKKTKEKIK